MQEALLLFFQKLSSPVLDTVVQVLTFFGEETVFILFIAALLWCFSKQKGFAIYSSLFSALIGMSVLKALIKYPRPFQVLGDIEGKRLSTATGYSFPSGHSTGAAAFYSSVSLIYKKRWLSIVSALLIALVGLSRIYLGVHWPLDVFGGLALGIGVSFALSSFFFHLYEQKEKLRSFCFAVGIGSTIVAVGLTLLLILEKADPLGFSDPMKLFALAGGGYLGFAWEQKHINYVTEANLAVKLLRLVFGLAILFFIQSLKSILGAHLAITLIRYYLIGLWVTFLYPLIGSKIPVGNNHYFFDC
ncbi:MAG: phosphatase PAP2 family protein [Sphaerochaetaceae bacterium]|jgi:membrane-associated phospholipid phosphatase